MSVDCLPLPIITHLRHWFGSSGCAGAPIGMIISDTTLDFPAKSGDELATTTRGWYGGDRGRKISRGGSNAANRAGRGNPPFQ